MKLYIVIPHYLITEHVAELARNAIKSFRDTCECVIISCDDCGPYDSSFLKDISDVYIRNEKNLGFAGNCNVGFNWIIENEKEDAYVVCVNNDVEVFEGWFEEFKRALDMYDGAMVGGLGYKGRMVEGMPIEMYRINPGTKFSSNSVSIGGRFDDWMFPGGFYMTTKNFLLEMSSYIKK